MLRTAVKERKPDNWADIMMAELLQERKANRVAGPFKAPSHWGFQTVGVPERFQAQAEGQLEARSLPQRRRVPGRGRRAQGTGRWVPGAGHRAAGGATIA